MNENILHKEVQRFIKEYKGEVTKLAFTGSPFQEITTTELIQQIESYRKTEKKLPTWYKTDNIYYPPKLSLEQTSSELTAKYKADLVNGNKLADLTGGLGVDSFYFAVNFDTVDHYEKNEELSEIARYNFEVFGKKNVNFYSEEGVSAIQNKHFDVIYADPSRRHDSKGKVFYLKDCEPNIPNNIDYFLERCDKLIIKTSPMLDISQGVLELKHIAEIHIIAINNDVKEIIWIAQKDASDTINIKTRNFKKKDVEVFDFDSMNEATSVYSEPLTYLYEPNAAILKGGAFHLIAERYGLFKLNKNTHLYTANTLKDFLGRRFKVIKSLIYSKKNMRTGINFDRANISTRNFPESIQQLKKRWKIKDGGDNYVFFTTVANDQKMMLICKKI